MIKSNLKSANILVVDDKQANIDVLTGFLDDEGYANYTSTTDPRRVVELFEEFKPDLILLDLQMPYMTGFQVMAQLKTLIPEETYLPILVLTADANTETKLEALAAGANDFLSKPFDLTEVELRIKNLLLTRCMNIQLKSQNLILEEKVEERTIELQKTIVELRAAKEKAEESDRLKSSFLANLSHEIRTPMNGILGFTQLLSDPDLISEEKERFIKFVHQSGQRMLNTVTDIVEISKIEAGLIQLNLSETDVNGRMQELFSFFHPEADKKGIKLSLELLLPPEDKHMTTDQNKLDSILTNLIKNAIKYTKSGTIQLGCLKKDDLFEFFIKDTGIGIPEHRQKAIFERFIQADITLNREYEGCGLGLAIAKSHVEMLGGKIWVESQEGKGSVFYFTLPLTHYATEKTVVLHEIPVDQEKNELMPVTPGLKILITEDDETSRNYISIIVKDFSNEILEAETGIETIELCRNTKGIDLVLMDIQIPGLNGYEATRRIREFNKEVVIIAQTAFALSGDREKALEAGCNDYITKPVKKEELQKLIGKYFK